MRLKPGVHLSKIGHHDIILSQNKKTVLKTMR